MTDLPVVLLAHGRQERLMDIPHPKHFLKVNGEAIISRTIRLLGEQEIRPSLVVAPGSSPWPEFCSSHGTTLLSYERDLPSVVSVVSAVLGSYPAGALFLLGDVVFSRLAIRLVLANRFVLGFFGKSGPNRWTGKRHNENYAFRCGEAGRIPVFNAVHRQNPGIPWKLNDLRIALKLPVNEIDDWTDDIDTPAEISRSLPIMEKMAEKESP